MKERERHLERDREEKERGINLRRRTPYSFHSSNFY